MKRYIVDHEFAQRLVNYLVKRPYREVDQFIAVLQRLPELQEKAPERLSNGDATVERGNSQLP